MKPTEPSRRERKKDDTRRRIFEVAVALFRAKGFEATTVEEITEKADVGRGTFFNYFPKKESVLAYLSEEKLIAAEENAQALLESPRPVREKLVEIFVNASQIYEEDPELSRFIFHEWMRRAFSPTQEVERRWQKLTIDVLEKGRTQGELRADLDSQRAEAVLSSVYIAAIFHFLFGTDGCSAPIASLRSEIQDRIDLVLDGLVPRPEVRA